jgi:hypothetical protein
MAKKHHFNPWREGNEGLGGLAKLAIQSNEAHSECARCQVKVKLGRVGGMKFWVSGKWTGRRPICTG